MHFPSLRRLLLLLTLVSVTAASAPAQTVLFLVGEQEYGTRESLPELARAELEPRGYRCEFVFAKSDDRKSKDCHEFPGFQAALKRADLLFLSVRRRYPVQADMDAIRAWIKAGRPVAAIRTSSHAFGERPKGAGYQAPSGHAAWNTLDRDLLGISYTGHFNARNGHECVVTQTPGAAGDRLLADLRLPERPLIYSHLYKSEVVDPQVRVLLRAKIAEENADEPVAWTLERKGQRTFYTSIGGPEDMKLPWFRRLLVNAVAWAVDSTDRAAEPVGEWVLTVKDQDGTDHHPRVQLSRSGGKLTASYVAASDGKDYDVAELRWEGGELAFRVDGPNWTVRYRGRVKQGTLAGMLAYDIAGQTGQTDFSGERVK